MNFDVNMVEKDPPLIPWNEDPFNEVIWTNFVAKYNFVKGIYTMMNIKDRSISNIIVSF